MSFSTNISRHLSFTKQEEILWDISLFSRNLTRFKEEISYLKEKIWTLSGRIHILASKLN